MNKCILFSFGLARARATNEGKKTEKNLKQMVKSNKKNKGRREKERDGEGEKSKREGKKEEKYK